MNENDVALTFEERDFVKEAADLRTEANKSRYDIADYDTRRFNLTRKQASRLGVFAEAVAFKWAGGNVLDHTLEEWAHFVPNNHPNYDALVKGQADLFGTIEVRRANRPHSPIPVRAKDRKSGVVVVQVYIPYRQPLATAANPHPAISVPLHGVILGWAYATDEGTRPDWAKQAGTVVVERRPLNTLDFKKVLGR